MFQFMIITCSLIISVVFMQMKHPLAMGLTLLTQTFLICIISGMMVKTFWFSYVLFLIFLGGMLVLFIYVTSLASNEMFSISFKLTMLSLTIFLSINFILMFMDSSMISSFINNSEMFLITEMKMLVQENSINLNKLYNFPTNLLTLLLINYLFLTLIVVVKITNNFFGPLRPLN